MLYKRINKMDSALEKVGLYDFFGVFISGMLVVVVCYYLNLPLVNLIENTDNDIVNVILFMLESYFLGLILQETSSVIDKKCFKFREKSRSYFLNDGNKIIDNELELKSFRKLANTILKIQDNNHIYSKDENEYVYYQCKTFLETHGKNDKVNRINSLYAMSRSLIVSLPLCLIVYFICNIKSLDIQNLIAIFTMVLLILIFYRRTKRFYTYKVRVILRHYKILNEKNI